MLDFIKEYWLSVLCTLVSGGATYVVKRFYSDFKKESEEQKCLKSGMISLLHNELFKNCKEYISHNEITVAELDNLESLYRSYHALGGNGTGTELYERCKKLKIKQ